jgi:hypothetical protein
VIGEELTGGDYFSQPLLELSSHPDFDTEIYAFVALISKMNTAKLKSLMERNDANG